MKFIENCEYNKKYLINDFLLASDYKYQRLYLEKSFCSKNGRSQYFLKLYGLKEGMFDCQGYIYFYIDNIKKESEYIGTYVKEEYRANGLASFLTSCWINFCFENDIYDLKTIKRQRKPFLLYLLKTYSFELKELEAYKLSNSNIHICKRENDYTKYLFFEMKNKRIVL